jgi:hypothetical protein
MTIASQWYVAVSMGDTWHEEVTDPDDFRDDVERLGGMSLLR